MGRTFTLQGDALRQVADRLDDAADGLATLLSMARGSDSFDVSTAAETATEHGRGRMKAVTQELRSFSSALRGAVDAYDESEQRNTGRYSRQ